MESNWQPADPEPGDVGESHTTDDRVASPGGAGLTPGSRNAGSRTARARVLGALVVGGIAGAAILGPLTAAAASPSPAVVTGVPSAAAETATDTDTETAGGPGGRVEAVTDASVIAKAFGITEADLTTALTGGQTVAAVAKAHNVALQTVIDALVADGTSELAARVTSGSITQAQADAQKAAILQRATDQANGSLAGGPGGHDGPGGPSGHVEGVTDASVAAAAIGISEADLTAALAKGQTIAAVAQAHSVAPQKVIDAFVADGQAELAAAVKAGTITQAQADAQKAAVVQRSTDQVNGTFSGGPGGPGGPDTDGAH